MRTQLDLLTERVTFAEVCTEKFRKQILAVDPVTDEAPDSLIAADAEPGIQTSESRKLDEQDNFLHRCSSQPTSSPTDFVVPESPAPPKPGVSPAFLLRLRVQAPSLSVQQLSTLSLNLSVLELGIPHYFDSALQGRRLRHPIEMLGRLSNTAIESLTLELRTLNKDYLGAQYTENRMMSVSDTDISAFVRQGRSIVNQEVNRTINYYHGVNRIAYGLCYYYGSDVVPLDNDSNTKPLLRSLTRSLSMAINNLRAGADLFERRLRDLAPWNAALQMGGNDGRLPASRDAKSAAGAEGDMQSIALPLTLPNVMRPSQTLTVSTQFQVCTIAQFFGEYDQILAHSYGRWAVLSCNLQRLVSVIREPKKRAGESLAENTVSSPCVKPCSAAKDECPCDDEQELALLRSLQCELVADDEDTDDSCIAHI